MMDLCAPRLPQNNLMTMQRMYGGVHIFRCNKSAFIGEFSNPRVLGNNSHRWLGVKYGNMSTDSGAASGQISRPRDFKTLSYARFFFSYAMSY